MLIYGLGEPFDDLFVFAEEIQPLASTCPPPPNADATAFTLTLPLLRSEGLVLPRSFPATRRETSDPSIVSG